MARHLIVGAGPVGNAVACELLDRGEQVTFVTRGGNGIAGTERVAADATDANRLGELAEGAVAIYNCVNPPYHRWATDWPPVANALLAAAESSGAVLAITGNLYGYGPVDRPMTEDLPLAATGVKGRVRAQMWHDALALHETGRPSATHIVTAIACTEGIEQIRRRHPGVRIWAGDVDDELTARGYIVPGLGDAGDLAYGNKRQA